MGTPVTFEDCGICGCEFQLEMTRAYKSGGWMEGDATLDLGFAGNSVEDCFYEKCCPQCLSTISNRFRVTVNEIREQHSSTDPTKKKKSRKVPA